MAGAVTTAGVATAVAMTDARRVRARRAAGVSVVVVGVTSAVTSGALAWAASTVPARSAPTVAALPQHSAQDARAEREMLAVEARLVRVRRDLKQVAHRSAHLPHAVATSSGSFAYRTPTQSQGSGGSTTSGSGAPPASQPQPPAPPPAPAPPPTQTSTGASGG